MDRNSKLVLKYCIVFYILVLNFWSFASAATVAKKESIIVKDESSTQSLKLLQVIHRHGDRNPTETFPTDEYKDEATYWPAGYGELTPLGRQQLFELGSYLRQRYAGFISDRYHRYDIEVTSSARDRTIMSAQAAMAGFYPPINSTNSDSDLRNNESWNPYINWQLVPVHTIPRENDSFIHMKAKCPKFTEIFKDYYKNGDYPRKMENDNKELKAFLLKNMGLPPDTTLQRLLTFQDTLLVHRKKNISLPSWLNESTFQELNGLKNFQFTVETSTPALKRLMAGPMLHKLTTNIENKIKSDKKGDDLIGESKRKLFVYSGHESTIGVFLNSLDIYNYVPPPYAATILLELHSMPTKSIANDKNKLYYIKILYRNDTREEPFELEVPGCSFPCSVEKLLSILEPIIPTNWEEECKLNSTVKLERLPQLDESFNFKMTSVWLLTGGMIMTMVLLAFGVVLKYPSFKKNLDGKYQTLP